MKYIKKPAKIEAFRYSGHLDEKTYISEDEEEYINIKWQEGTIPDHGVNGVQVIDVIQVALDRVEKLNALYPCKENEDTILMLEQAILHQNLRTRNRKLRGVEGTNNK